MRKLLEPVVLAMAIAVASLSISVAAADPATVPHLSAKPGSDEAVRAYWTPERLLAAKPLSMTLSGSPQRVPKGSGDRIEPEIVHGALPTLKYDFSLATDVYGGKPQTIFGHPPLVGTGKQPYTTNRLYPVNDTALYKIYPYATVGHLYFHEPAGDFQCSASVIRLNTIATAGHCVSDGHGKYFSNWMFIPAQNAGVAPFGTWTWTHVVTTSAWHKAGGGVPNTQDDAIIVLNLVRYNGVLRKVGELTGYLGYEFNTPLPTAITQLGYPCNLDNCSDPIATYAQPVSARLNNFEWGSASFGGASGGPVLQDFGQPPSGVPNEAFGGNILVANFSYFYTNTAVQVDGGSILWASGQGGQFTFGDDINYACTNGGC